MDARACPSCGATGIVALDTDPSAGPTTNPAVVCRDCGAEWVAAGTQFAFDVPGDMTDEELDALADEIAKRMTAAVPPQGG
jgi:hypothetical protein